MSSRGRPVRVVFASLSRRLGGAERSMLGLLPRLYPRGVHPILVCPPGELRDRARALRVETRPMWWLPVPSISSRSGGAKSYGLVRAGGALGASAADGLALAAAVRALQADVVVSNSFRAHPFVTLAGVIARRPSVLYVRDIVDPGRGRALLDRCARRAAAVIAVSSAVAETTPSVRAHVVTNPVTLTDGFTAAPRDDDRPVVGFVGRLDANKGVEDILAAAREVDARFLIAGARLMSPRSYEDELRRQAAALPPGRVEMLGRIDGPEALLARADVLVVPSRREPWGRVAAEGLIAGVPVVAADSGGLPEIVTDGVDGLLYPPGDVPALVERLRALVDDPSLRVRLGDAGRTAAPRFSPETNADTVASILREVAG